MKTHPFALRNWMLFASVFGLWLGCCGLAAGGDIDPLVKGSWPGLARGPTEAVAVSDKYAYVGTGYENVSGSQNLYVIDISDPTKPRWVGGCALSDSGRDVAVSGNYASLADSEGGLVVLELLLPSVRPALSAQWAANGTVISWPSPSTGFVLQQNTDLGATDWVNVGQAPADNGTTKSITVSPGAGRMFYRLKKQ